MQNKLFVGFMMFFTWSFCSAADTESLVAPQRARIVRSADSSAACINLVAVLNSKLQDVVFRTTFYEWVKDNWRQQQFDEGHQLSSMRVDESTELRPVVPGRVLLVGSAPLDPTKLSVKVVQSKSYDEPIVNIEQRNYTYFISSGSVK